MRDLLDAISFQIKDGWERMAGVDSPKNMDYGEADRIAIQRIKEAVGKGGGY